MSRFAIVDRHLFSEVKIIIRTISVDDDAFDPRDVWMALVNFPFVDQIENHRDGFVVSFYGLG